MPSITEQHHQKASSAVPVVGKEMRETGISWKHGQMNTTEGYFKNTVSGSFGVVAVTCVPSSPKLIAESLEIIFCIPAIKPTEKTHLFSKMEKNTRMGIVSNQPVCSPATILKYSSEGQTIVSQKNNVSCS